MTLQLGLMSYKGQTRALFDVGIILFLAMAIEETLCCERHMAMVDEIQSLEAVYLLLYFQVLAAVARLAC